MKKFQVEFSAPERRASKKIVKFMSYLRMTFDLRQNDTCHFGGAQLSLRDTLRLNTSLSAVESGSGEK